MGKVFRLLRSLRLTLVLVSLLALGFAVSTLVPQGLAPEWYKANYSPFVGFLIGLIGLSRFFVSPVFLALAMLFWINLLSCTVHRFVCQLKLKRAGYYGPDILHAGILLLVAASAGSAFFRASASVELAVGEGVELPGGVYLRVESLAALVHDDGRPKDWITTVKVLKQGQADWESAVIRVNHPLKVGKLRLYQYSWKQGLTLDVTRGSETLRLEPGASSVFRSGTVVQWAGTGTDTATGSALYGLVIDGAMHTLAAGKSVNGIQVAEARNLERTVLMVGKDDSFGLVLVSFIVCLVGLLFIARKRVRELMEE